MAVCVAFFANKLELTSTPISSCAQYILYSASEMSHVVSQSDAIQASGLVMTVWALAWGFRILRRVL